MFDRAYCPKYYTPMITTIIIIVSNNGALFLYFFCRLLESLKTLESERRDIPLYLQAVREVACMVGAKFVS